MQPTRPLEQSAGSGSPIPARVVGFLKRNPRVVLFLFFLVNIALISWGPDVFAWPPVNDAITAVFCIFLVRIQVREMAEFARRRSRLTAITAKYTFMALMAVAQKGKGSHASPTRRLGATER